MSSTNEGCPKITGIAEEPLFLPSYQLEKRGRLHLFSPDISPMDFFPWDFLEKRIYADNTKNDFYSN